MAEVFEGTENDELPEMDELVSLKKRADTMGVRYHPNIGLDKLREKVNEHLSDAVKEPVVPVSSEEPVVVAKANDTNLKTPIEFDANNTVRVKTDALVKENETLQERNARLRREAGELIRIRLSCMNPNKKEWEGEMFTVSNNVVGTHKRYIPFNSEDGWHVPRIIYNVLVNRKCQIFVTKRDAKGNRVRRGKLIKEFSIEVLPNLTTNELSDLAKKQAVSRSSVDD